MTSDINIRTLYFITFSKCSTNLSRTGLGKSLNEGDLVLLRDIYKSYALYSTIIMFVEQFSVEKHLIN